MPIRFLLILLLAMPGMALADASTGDFMGYQLGSKYQRGADTRQQTTTTGNLLITAEKPVKPADIAEVTLLTTPESLTIAYISASQWFATEAEAREMGRQYFELLRAKYPDWVYGWEVMDPQMNIVEVSMRQLPHNLRLRLTRDNHNGETKWRFSMTLGWVPESAAEVAWRDQSVDEQMAGRKDAQKGLLDEADVRGL
jgi:hypothetical protein